QVVDLVDGPVAFAWRVALLLGVVGALHVDRVRRARPRAQFAADAFLEPVRVAVELVPAVEAGRGGHLLLRVLLGVGLPEHAQEGNAEPGDRFEALRNPRHDRPPRWTVGGADAGPENTTSDSRPRS